MPPPTGLRKTSILDANGSSFQSFLTAELKRTEDIEFSSIPDQSYSIFGEVIDIIKHQMDELVAHGIKQHEDSFLDLRYYINQHHSELLKRSSTLSNRRSSHDFQDIQFSNSNSGGLLRSHSTSLREEQEYTLGIQRVASNVVPHHSPDPHEFSMKKSKDSAKFCHLVEFVIIIQELVQVYIHHINILLKSESNLIRKLDLYCNLVFR
jgi:hypothetical protein